MLVFIVVIIVTRIMVLSTECLKKEELAQRAIRYFFIVTHVGMEIYVRITWYILIIILYNLYYSGVYNFH